MALEVSIDTLDFDALVAEAQRRIIPRTRGQWTLHAPVDPGITLIELYAWLLDQRSYWANHVDGDYGRALLRLLGDAPRPARAARVPLAIEAGVTTPVPAGTRFRFAPAGTALWFATQNPVTALPLAPAPFALRSDGVDLTIDLRSGRSVDVMTGSGGASRVELDLVLTAALAGAVPDVGVAFAIDTAGDVDPEWSPDAVAAAPPATLTFSYRTATGWSALTVTDGTGGLRRPGILHFTLPADAAPLVAPNTWTYTIALATTAATFTAPPRVTAVAPNAVIASHSIATTFAPPTVPLPLPGAQIELPAPPIESSVALSIVELDGNPYAWQPASDFTSFGPGDRVFVVDRARSAVTFGDGLTGRLLCASTSIANPISATFDAGGGTAGNVGLGTWFSAGNTLEATSFAPAIGGRDSEALADAEARVANRLRDRTRAATAADYATIATTTPGVAIARGFAAIGFDPAEPCLPAPGVVTVFVVPGVPDRTAGDLRSIAAPVTDPGALAAVAARFAATRLLGTQVNVATARYRDVAVRVALTGDPWDPAATRANIEAAIRAWLDPLLGGAERAGWPFGNPVRPSDLLRIAQLAAGEDGDVMSVGVALDGSDDFELCGDVALNSYELPDVTSVEVDITPEGAP